MFIGLTSSGGSSGGGSGNGSHFLEAGGDVLVAGGFGELGDTGGEGLGIGFNTSGLKELLDVIDGC